MKVLTQSLILILFISTEIYSQSLNFIENKQQWQKNVQYKVDISGGQITFLSDKIMFNFIDALAFHKNNHSIDENSNDSIKGFGYQMEFMNGNPLQLIGVKKKQTYYNYFVGNNKSSWASHVPAYEELYSHNTYNNINYRVYSNSEDLKYDFIVEPHGNPEEIRLKYTGLNRIEIKNGDLILHTEVGEIIEKKPYSYQIINGKKIEIPSQYILEGDVVKFELGEYDRNFILVIDPKVIAATLSGQGNSLLGYGATYDKEGNLYVSGTGYASNQPGSVGVYYLGSGGSNIVINKYNQDGSNLIYSTVIGGSNENSFPGSLIVENSNLYILGTTNASDYPTSEFGYDTSYNGNYDMVVTILDKSGGVIIGSTFLGGAEDDFALYSSEIISDDDGNCYFVGESNSSNFPITSGAFQTIHGGGIDGVVLKLNSDVSNLIFGTYLGGPNDDGASGIKYDGDKVYVCGRAGTEFFTSTGAFGYNGETDGFVLTMDKLASQIVNGTYIGTDELDIAIFLELNNEKEILVMGSTDGILNTTAGSYDGGDGNFIAKFKNDLSEVDFVSTFCFATPISFGVDNCGLIYTSFIGPKFEPPYERYFTEDSLPRGANYFTVLNSFGTELRYGSIYKGGGHVHGRGRFDKDGILYEAACSKDRNAFFTTPNAFYSNGNGGLDMSVFKIDFEQQVSSIIIDTIPNVFSPNGDGINDLYKLNIRMAGCRNEDVTTRIYNRWGQLIFKSSDKLFVWDGKTKEGKDVADGVYYVVVQLNDTPERTRKTSLTVFRNN